MVNDASSSVNKLKASLNDAARGVIYEHHMFIVQATGSFLSPKVAKAITVLSLEQDVLQKKLCLYTPGAVFATLHFLCNLRISPIS